MVIPVNISFIALNNYAFTHTFTEGWQFGSLVRRRYRPIAAAQADIRGSVGVVEIATMWADCPPRTCRLRCCNAAGRACYCSRADVWWCRRCHLCDIWPLPVSGPNSNRPTPSPTLVLHFHSPAIPFSWKCSSVRHLRASLRSDKRP